MIEAELKARVRNPQALKARLSERADEERSIYRDAYYDLAGLPFTQQGRELRVRVVETEGLSRAVLTYKEPAIDAASGSKPEHETPVADPAVIDTILTALGAVQVIAFSKHCANYRFTARGRDMLATVVTVPEIDGTFIEVETMTAETHLTGALTDIRAVLADLGIIEEDLTTELYTEAVQRARA